MNKWTDDEIDLLDSEIIMFLDMTLRERREYIADLRGLDWLTGNTD